MLPAIWDRIERLLQQLAPPIRESLQPGASETTLHQVEVFLPVTLPEEVKTLYRIHDGQGDHNYYRECTGLVDGWFFSPLLTLCHSWLINRLDFGLPGGHTHFPCLTRERASVDWHPQWLPFMSHQMGPAYCIDLAPGPTGRRGQILFHNDCYCNYPDPHAPGHSSIRVVASGIEEFFSKLADDLEVGVYTFDEATGRLWSKQMWEAMLAVKRSRCEWFGTIEEDQLTCLKRERRTYQQLALPIREEREWDDLYREHPLWNPSSFVRDNDPDDDWF
jgi:cell wall assembly regulator SMI1